MRALALALALALAPPVASALDVLPAEAHLSDIEARILVRSRDGDVRVETDPPTLAAASAPVGEPGEFGATPRVLPAEHTWHGLDRVVVVVLRRDTPKEHVDIVIEDGTQTGAWLEWPAAKRGAPGPGLAGVGLGLIAAAKGFAVGRRPRR